jgi:hypothetical protein
VQTFPLAAFGRNEVYSNPDFLLPPTISFDTFSAPIWDYEELGTSPPESWEPKFRLLRIPTNPALVGLLVSVQSFRYSGSTFWISDEAVFFIG